MTELPRLSGIRNRRGLLRRALAALRWALLGLAVIIGLVYVRLLFGPIPLDFLSDRVQSAVAGVVEDDFEVAWEGFGLSLDGPFNPVFRLASVEMREVASDAVISMDALEVGVSPVGLLLGRPNARITLDGPHFQIVQDLLGPRPARFVVQEDPNTGEVTVAVHEGANATPVVRIERGGLDLGAEAGDDPAVLRSDNAVLMATVEAIDAGLAELAERALGGQISSLSVRNGSVAMLDRVYNLYREFEGVDFDLRAGQSVNGVSARFSARIAGRETTGTITRVSDGSAVTLNFALQGLDFSTLLPFLDDPVGIAALRGVGGLSGTFQLTAPEGRLTSGRFTIDLAGTHLRLANDMFAVAAAPFTVDWHPDEARFQFADVGVSVGRSRGTISGEVLLGFDQQFGPTLAMNITAQEVYLHPDDMPAPQNPIESIRFEGWGAPLYGAVGIDQLTASTGDASLSLTGRMDSLRAGLGLKLSLSGQGFSADTVKRLWPYIFAPEGRAWVVDYVGSGTVANADMAFDFPVGSIAVDGSPLPIPDGAIRVEMSADGVELLPFAGMPRLDIAGETRVLVRDEQVTVGVDRATVAGTDGPVVIENAAFLNQDTTARRPIFEVSGDISGTVPDLLSLADDPALGALDEAVQGVDVAELRAKLSGEARATVIATLKMDDIGLVDQVDYTLNGTIAELSTREPIGGYAVSDASLSFTASQAGFNANGSGMLGSIPFDFEASQNGEEVPGVRVASTFDAEDAAAFGVDLSEYVDGEVRLVAEPLGDDRYQVSADLTGAALTLADIGARKAQGIPGGANAVVEIGEDGIAVPEADLGFGEVRLAGSLAVSSEGALEEAIFSTFQISPGDNAQVAIRPADGGYAVSVSGAQLDVRPMLRRFVSLDSGALAGPSEDLGDERFSVTVNLDRAIGYYGAVALDVDLDLRLRGDTLEHVDLSAGLGGGRSVSATTNGGERDRVMSFAANDVGGILRFVGLYPRLIGGEGSLVIRRDIPGDADSGAFEMRNFSIVDEANIARLLQSDEAAEAYAERGNSLDFTRGRAQFMRIGDRIELREAALYGDSVGGTARGNILLEEGQYDLTGTYVPLFGINNAFQQIPLIGPIFGGREGEGLIGVTFAVRGPLAEPELLINPVSILAPGVFRSLFEYRAQNEASAQ
ncbi:AsmA-like C-terminal region-containing protein [Pelagibacterium xiamenense]|uniref:AsmA-like C-terminal region-containing protein n=1 Tax=Pelagibacterium xiamenense TaxID=2901140 RepID=UPI001E3CE4BB|nr:AsmA-like C-terminal region-containing protein [Pelagibacterium xiamenense]MCD7061103.1 AsmA-like C-terminal region-containing protein [Pelagibacterium xiamenense]